MRILIYHGKYGNEYWLADTPERLNAAMKRLFTFLDEQGCYDDNTLTLANARAGDERCIRLILERRRLYEYEEWELEEVKDPCTN
jgi:hypothetical protein